MEEKKTKNIGLIIIVIILLLTCIGMGAFIFINKDKITSQKSNTTTMTNDNKNVEDKKTECTKISYDINTDQYSLSANAVGISVLVDSTRKTARISVNAAAISSAFGLSLVTTTDTSTYELIGTKFFDKKIVQVLIDGSGQDASSATILYLMEDGMVEYVPILKDINTNWSQADNTKKFNSYGKLNGIADIISLVPAESKGYHTVLARKVDGTVINLADIFKATGNFN